MAKKRAAKKPAKKPAKKAAKKKAAKKPAKKASPKAKKKKSSKESAGKGRKKGTKRSASPGPALLVANPSRSAALAPTAPVRPGGAPAAPAAPRKLPGPPPEARRAFEDAFANAAMQVRAIAVRLRRIILESLPEAREEPFGGERVRGLRYYAAERHLNPTCSIQPGDDHCQLVFKDGSRLTDPLRLLIGSGEGIRHVRIAGFDSPPESALRDLISQARAIAR